MTDELRQAFTAQFGDGRAVTVGADGVSTVHAGVAEAPAILNFFRAGIAQPYGMLFDLTAQVEQGRRFREVQTDADFSVVYTLTSLERNADLRVRVPLPAAAPHLSSVVKLWPNADWYEREAWDMFGIRFDGHPRLKRLLMPEWWSGHPLRKDHPCRATELPPFAMNDAERERLDEDFRFRPEEWGFSLTDDMMIVNLGPQHPGTHGLLRLAVAVRGEEIIEVFPEIGFHHRGAEKMAERQSWHTFIPYTDRVDYTAGVLNNLPYLLAVEKLAGITVPERAQAIRVMLSELFRIISHLVWLGTFAQDLGQMSPVFYTFSDREHAFDIVAAITGGRMHPGWCRIGGIAADLPDGWAPMMKKFIRRMHKKLAAYDKLIIRNAIIRGRTRGIGAFTREEAVAWGVTGTGLRATGVNWDLRKARPYSGYEQFEFDIPLGTDGDCWERSRIRVEEMRQSLRILEQCLAHLPGGAIKADHPLTTPPDRTRTEGDIDTLIHHFLGTTWGPVIPAGEAMIQTEGAKGAYGYHLVSDGGTSPWRCRIRSGSFAQLQMVPFIARGHSIADLLAILGALDFVLADIDR